MKVDHIYKTHETVTLDVALRSVGLHFDFKHVDLIMTVINELKEKGDSMTLKDSARIEALWIKKWENYKRDIEQNPRTQGNDLMKN